MKEAMTYQLIYASQQIGFPILTTLLVIPIIGAIILLFINKNRHKAIMQIATLFAFITFLVSIPLALKFDKSTPAMQFVEKVDWIKSIGVSYFLGIDGISILLVLLTTLLSFIAVLSSWTAITERRKEYYIFLLILETGMLGVFMALDFFLFYLFWEVMLVPMYFLIGVWGGPRKLYAAIKFFLYTLFGSVIMLVAILALYFMYHDYCGGNCYTFNFVEILKMPISIKLQRILFWAFFLGFAIKVPMFPFHTWLPDAHTEAPTAGSVILAGILLKMGTYGFVRFSLPLFPEATKEYLPILIFLSIVGIIYGALVAMMQPDMKKLIAYSSVSHLGFVMLGVFAMSHESITGGILQMINHGLSTGALFLIVGLIYERRHTRMISEFGGLSKQLPVYAAFYLIVTLSSIGLPGLNGFVGEFLILLGTFKKNWLWALIATSGIVLGAAYMLWLYQRVMFGKLDKPENKKLKDLNLREVATLVPIVIFMFWIGLYPMTWTSYMSSSVNYLKEMMNKKLELVSEYEVNNKSIEESLSNKRVEDFQKLALAEKINPDIDSVNY